MNGVPSSAVTSNFDGSIAAVLRDEFSVDLPSAANTMANLLCAGLLFLFLEVTFMSVLALRQGLARDGWLGDPKKPQPGRTGRARFAAGRGARLACRERHAGAHVARPHRHRPAGPR